MKLVDISGKKEGTCESYKWRSNSKSKNNRDLYRGISDFKKGYQHKTNILNEEKDRLFTESHCILARWGKHFSQLLNIRGFTDVMQIEVQRAEPLVSESSAFEFEMAVEKLKRRRSPDNDHISAELFKAGSRTIRYGIHTLINSI